MYLAHSCGADDARITRLFALLFAFMTTEGRSFDPTVRATLPLPPPDDNVEISGISGEWARR